MKWGNAGQVAWNTKQITDDALALIEVHQDQSWSAHYTAIFSEAT
jgi:hypothetical protein